MSEIFISYKIVKIFDHDQKSLVNLAKSERTSEFKGDF